MKRSLLLTLCASLMLAAPLQAAERWMAEHAQEVARWG